MRWIKFIGFVISSSALLPLINVVLGDEWVGMELYLKDVASIAIVDIVIGVPIMWYTRPAKVTNIDRSITANRDVNIRDIHEGKQ